MLDDDTRRAYASRVRQYLIWLDTANPGGDPLCEPGARDGAARDWMVSGSWGVWLSAVTTGGVQRALTARSVSAAGYGHGVADVHIHGVAGQSLRASGTRMYGPVAIRASWGPHSPGEILVGYPWRALTLTRSRCRPR